MHRFAVVIAITAAGAVAGCATVFKSKSAPVTVTSATPGAQVLVDGMPAGVTPTRLALSTRTDHLIVVRAATGEQSCQIRARAATGWVVLGIVATPAWIVDLITKNWNSLDRSECMVTL